VGNNICEHPSAHKSDSPESIVSDDCIHDPITVFDLLSKFSGLTAVTVITGLALIHLVNLSMATNRWSKFPGVFGSFPTKSSPRMAKGHVIGIVCSS
jgi:hypothetical protein